MIFCLLVLGLPNFSETSLANDVQIVEHILLNFQRFPQGRFDVLPPLLGGLILSFSSFLVS